jgi:hypothetical protein
LYFKGNITKNNQVSNAARKSHMTTRTSTHDLKQNKKEKKSVNIWSSLVNRGTIIFTLLYTHLLTNKAISDYLCPLVAEGTKI